MSKIIKHNIRNLVQTIPTYEELDNEATAIPSVAAVREFVDASNVRCAQLSSREEFEEWAASEDFGFAVCLGDGFESPFFLVKAFNLGSEEWEVKSLGTLGDPWTWPED